MTTTFYRLLKNSILLTACALLLTMPLSLPCMADDYVVKMKRKSGVYTLPCEVNGVKRDFIFDTGAAKTSLSQEFVNELLRKKALLQTDFTGAIQTRNASGKVDNNTTVNIRSLKVGNRMIYNLQATIAVGQKAPLLLGLNAIDLLGEWTMKKDLLVLHDYNTPTIIEQNIITTPKNNEVLFEDVEQMINNNSNKVSPSTEEVVGNATHPGIRVRAYKGDAEAQYLMGMYYLNGDGVDLNPEVAVHWIRLSAMQNYRPAQRQLAECYSLGIGVEANDEAAYYWHQMAESEPLEPNY